MAPKVTLDQAKRVLEIEATHYGTTIPEGATITYNESENKYNIFRIDLVKVKPGDVILSSWVNGEWEDK